MPKTIQEDVMKSWAEAQHRLWDGWLEAMGHAGTGLPTATGANPTEVWSRLIDTWEPFVRQTLDAQAAAMQAWAEGLSAAPNVPEHLRPQLQQVQELTRGWMATQRQMWDAMFGASRQFATATGGEHPHAQQLPNMELWQQFARPAMEAQATWLRNWSGVLAGGRSGYPRKESEA
jgi:hypothetical protein